MTRGNKERLEALSPEGKLFPLKAKERANPLSLVATGFPKVHTVSMAIPGGLAGEEVQRSRLRMEGNLLT